MVRRYFSQNVIKVCKKDPLNYLVSDKLDELNAKIDNVADADTSSTKTPLSKMKLEELKAVAEKIGIDTSGLTRDELIKIIKSNHGD